MCAHVQAAYLIAIAAAMIGWLFIETIASCGRLINLRTIG
jgi:hypothetical protein